MTANRWTLIPWARWDVGLPDKGGAVAVPVGLRLIPNRYPKGHTLWRSYVRHRGEGHTSEAYTTTPAPVDARPESHRKYLPFEPLTWDDALREPLQLARWGETPDGWTFTVEPEEWATATPAELVGLLGMLWGANDPHGKARKGRPLAVVGIDELTRGVLEADGLDQAEESAERALKRLTGELAGLVVELREALDLTPDGLARLWTPDDGWRTDDGMLWLEARMIAEIRQQFGVDALPNGTADRYRERWEADRDNPARLLRGWLDPSRWDNAEGDGWASPAGWLPFVARLLWRHRVQPAWARQIEAEERARKNAPGLPMPVHSELGDSLVAAIHDRGRIVRKADGRQIPLRFAAVDAAALDAVPLGALGKLTAHRLVRWMIQAAHAGHFLTTDNAVNLMDGVTARRGATGVDLVVTGGLSRLAEVVGAGSKKATGDLRDALNVLSQVTLQWNAPGSEGGGSLVSWRGPGSGGAHPGHGARSVVRITVSDVLCPGMGAKLRGSADALVVPVLDVPVMPAAVSPRAHAGLARFDWLVTRELVARAREAVGNGGVVLNLDTIGKDAGVNRKNVAAAAECWTTDTADAPARWERNGSRYMLADRPPTAAARRWILDFAETREGRSKGGQESGRRRRLKLTKAIPRRK